MIGRLGAMHEPLKYVQGREALLKFHEEMGYMGKRRLFECSNSGYKACYDKIEKNFCDSSYFCKIFKRFESITPSQFRNTEQVL